MRVRFVLPDGSIVARTMKPENVPNPGGSIELKGARYTVARLSLHQGERDEALVVLRDGGPTESRPKRLQRRSRRPAT